MNRNSGGPVVLKYAALLFILALLVCAVGCSSPTEPVNNDLPTDVASYHFTSLGTNRYYELNIQVAFTSTDTVADTPYSVDTTLIDTLIDSVWRWEEIDGIRWFRSILTYSTFSDSAGTMIRLGKAQSNRRVGLQADTLFYDQSIRDRILVGPLEVDKRWWVDEFQTQLAIILGEEELALQIGPTRTWHVTRGAVGSEWYAPDLGRVRYEETSREGYPVSAVLIAVGSL